MGFEFLLLANNLWFASALGVMFGILTIETFSLLMGLGISDAIDNFIDFDIHADCDVDCDVGFELDAIDIDADLDVDLDTNLELENVGGSNSLMSLLGWLGFGKVPFLIVLSAFLASFGLAGIILQSVMFTLSTITLPGLVAIPIAFLLSLPVTSKVSFWIGAIMPDDESTAIRLEDLRGKQAVITLGTTTVTRPTEAKVTDRYGRVHYIRVIPGSEDDSFTKGDKVILDEFKDNTFRVSSAS